MLSITTVYLAPRLSKIINNYRYSDDSPPSTADVSRFKHLARAAILTLPAAASLLISPLEQANAQLSGTASFTLPQNNVREGTHLVVDVELSASQSANAAITVTATTPTPGSGSAATAGTDFPAGPWTITVPAGQTTANLTFARHDD